MEVPTKSGAGRNGRVTCKSFSEYLKSVGGSRSSRLNDDVGDHHPEVQICKGNEVAVDLKGESQWTIWFLCSWEAPL